ncbi:MAG: anti-sigma factor [Caldimonas sp.]
MNPLSSVTEADLHAWVDRQLSAERAREVEDYLAVRPDEAERLEAYRAQQRELHALYDPVLDEPLPQRVLQAARRRPRWIVERALETLRLRPRWVVERIAAGLAIALLGGVIGWALRGNVGPELTTASAMRAPTIAGAPVQSSTFAQRAAIAHAVYSPEVRRPVEVGAEHEDQLVTWLSKRMGAPMKPPHLQALGYTLEGGRLLPGGQGPVAQFMYRDPSGARLTLYVSNEVAAAGAPTKAGSQASRAAAPPTPVPQRSTAAARNADTAFRFAQEGAVNVFYWVEGSFGYALSSAVSRDELARVSGEVYRQLAADR